MKIILLVGLLILFNLSCVSYKTCNNKEAYLENDTDTTKEYKIKGKYCITTSKDSATKNENATVDFSVFDRINGKLIENGVIWFYGNDTTKINFSNLISKASIKPGKYIIEAWEAGYNGTRTKKIVLKTNIITKIYFYLGTSKTF